MFVECKEYYFDSIVRVFGKRKLAFNTDDVSSYFQMYDTEKKKTVVRVCLKTGRYHDVDAEFDTIHSMITKGVPDREVEND